MNYDYGTYYQSITKPFFAPQEWVFGLAWGIIYPLIVIAFAYLVFLILKKRVPVWLLWLFAVNILANLAFTPIQLGLGNTLLATLDILIVLSTLAFFEYKIYRYSRAIFALLLPYLLWGSFATVLQITIIVIN